MTEPVTLSYYTTRGTIYYTPPSLLALKSQTPTLPTPPCRPRQRRPHSIHITRLPAGFVPFDLRPLPTPKEPKKPSRFRLELRKLASRENAKRVFGSVFSPFSSNSSTASTSAADSTRSASPGTPRSPRPSLSLPSSDPATIFARRAASTMMADTVGSRSALADRPNGPSPRNSISGSRHSISSQFPPPLLRARSSMDTEKPVCSGNGLDHDGTTRDSPSSSVAVLRGKLQLNVTKSVKIKTVTLKFLGRAKTEWPEGIPPEKTEQVDEMSLKTQIIPFFNALYEGSEIGYGAMCNYTLREKSSASSSVTNLSLESSSGFSLPGLSNRSSRASTILSTKEQKRLSLQSNQSRSFTKSESPFGPTPQQKGYKVFHPGVYEYNFELPIDNNSPETTKLPLAEVKWTLECVVERAGTFKANLQGVKEVPVIRSPSEDSLELVEPISISRKWEDQLHYEIMISGKSFPIGSKIPIAFKLMPLAKVQVHKLKVFVSENIEYYAHNKKVVRRETARKILLFEKSAAKPLAKEYSQSEVRVVRGGERTPEERASLRDRARRNWEQRAQRLGIEPEPLPDQADNMLGDIELGGVEGFEQLIGPTEIEMNVQLPSCEIMEKDKFKRLHHACSWKNVDVHHWIKIVMRISRVDADDPTGKKRRHFEISIDSPISILNCRATQANLALPKYSDFNNSSMEQQFVCGCPNAPASNQLPSPASGIVDGMHAMPEDPNAAAAEQAARDCTLGLARPPQAHLSTNAAAGIQRPIHLLRNPSYNPPPFDAEQPPPPMPTPPPIYDEIIGTPSHDGFEGYFARMRAEGYSWDGDQNTDSDEEDMNRATSRGRVNVANPRTPGGRIARSMDIDRNFMFAPGAANSLYTRSAGTEASVGSTT